MSNSYDRRRINKAKKERERRVANKKKKCTELERVLQLKKTKREALNLRNSIVNEMRILLQLLSKPKTLIDKTSDIIYTISRKRYDIPYHTEELKEAFEKMYDKYIEVRDNFTKLTDDLRTIWNTLIDPPIKDKSELAPLELQGIIMNQSLELLAQHANIVKVNHEIFNFYNKFFNDVDTSLELREKHGDMTIMPIVNEDEKKALSMYRLLLNAYMEEAKAMDTFCIDTPQENEEDTTPEMEKKDQEEINASTSE